MSWEAGSSEPWRSPRKRGYSHWSSSRSSGRPPLSSASASSGTRAPKNMKDDDPETRASIALRLAEWPAVSRGPISGGSPGDDRDEVGW